MADAIYNRKYHIFFSIPLIPRVEYTNGWAPTPGVFTPDDILKYVEILKTDPNGATTLQYETQEETYGFSDLNIKFKIEKNVKTDANTCNLTIYNADPDLIGRLDAYQGGGVAFEMRVGNGLDKTTLPLIFRGTVDTAISKRKNQVVETTLKISDGTKNLKETYSKRSYRKATPLEGIIGDLISDLGLQKGFIQGITSFEPSVANAIVQAKAYAGKTITSLKRVCDTLKADLSIQDGHVYICQKGKRIPLFGSTPVLSEASGVIEELRMADTNSESLANDTDSNRARYTIKTLMLPDVLPHTSVYVKNDAGENIPYKVESVTHNGEYEGNEWYSTLSLSSADPIQ